MSRNDAVELLKRILQMHKEQHARTGHAYDSGYRDGLSLAIDTIEAHILSEPAEKWRGLTATDDVREKVGAAL